MREVEKRTRVGRRRFLVGAGATTVGVVALSTGAALVDPRGAWAMSLEALSPETAKTLLVMARDLYPHDRLGDAFYAKAIEPYDAAAAKDPALKQLLTEGAARLDELARARTGTAYAEIGDEATRVELLRAIEKTPFFAKLRGDMITALYNQPEVWAKFGYEGPSADKGGYIERGFNDLDWLKEG